MCVIKAAPAKYLHHDAENYGLRPLSDCSIRLETVWDVTVCLPPRRLAGVCAILSRPTATLLSSAHGCNERRHSWSRQCLA